MAEELIIPKSTDKAERYELLYKQTEALLKGEDDLIANLANMVSVLKYGMDFFWVGFYFVKNEELVLGPFQGTIACTRIAKGKGVCGTAWLNKETILVDNVDEFPGHIACSSASKSEIVVPVIGTNNNVSMVLDVDSDKLNDFDKNDKIWLEKFVQLITTVK